jgi:hypothetical protein
VRNAVTRIPNLKLIFLLTIVYVQECLFLCVSPGTASLSHRNPASCGPWHDSVRAPGQSAAADQHHTRFMWNTLLPCWQTGFNFVALCKPVCVGVWRQLMCFVYQMPSVPVNSIPAIICCNTFWCVYNLGIDFLLSCCIWQWYILLIMLTVIILPG